MCGTWDVDGLLETIPARVFSEWAAYFNQEPWGDEVTNKQLAKLCAIGMQLGGEKNAKAEDFLPTTAPDEPAKPKSDEELHAKFTQYVGHHNRKVGV